MGEGWKLSLCHLPSGPKQIQGLALPRCAAQRSGELENIVLDKLWLGGGIIPKFIKIYPKCCQVVML